jgi:hypothetical protein
MKLRSIILVALGCTTLTIVGAFVGTELWLRQQIWEANVVDTALWNMSFYSAPIDRGVPNIDISFRFYGPHAQLQASADFHLNNRGWISPYNYKFERDPGEFRIVILGGEQAASSVASHSWPNLLQDELNRRSPSNHYIFNCAWPDAGPQKFIQYWQTECAKYSPDLVIVNYVESDFYRIFVEAGAPTTYRGELVTGSAWVEYGAKRTLLSILLNAKPAKPSPMRSGADGARIPLSVVRNAEPTSMRDLNAIPSRPYGFFASRSLMDDVSRVAAIQECVVREMIEGIYPPFGSLTYQLLTDHPQAIPKVSEVRNYDIPPASKPANKTALAAAGVREFGWMVRHIPNVVFVHNFNYASLKDSYELTAAMERSDKRIKVVDMRQFIPSATTDEELKSWYLFPFMTEKWSEKGHGVYAKMMADRVQAWRAGGRVNLPRKLDKKSARAPWSPAPTNLSTNGYTSKS